MAEQVDALSPAGVSELASFIIRPPRAQYSSAELGDRVFVVERVPACREDIELRNARGQKLHCSHFKAVAAPNHAPTVVYLHGNGSCRVEATMLLHYVLPYGLSLFAFDFSGSGRSDGEYISLGVNEKHDVETVVDYLISECGVSRIVLWGHSMGAATAVMYAGLCNTRPEVRALVLDSPFASFDKLAQSMVADMPIPAAVPRKLILTVGVRAVRKAVRERAGFDVTDIDPLSAAKKINYSLPALFLHGTADAVVPLTHGEQLHKAFPGNQKEKIVMRGFEHDTPRPEWVMDRVHIFLQQHLRESGVRDILYLDYLKGRGNAAMLAGRFGDSVHLYSEALNALSQSMTRRGFSAAVGDSPSRRRLNDEDEAGQSLARRNSSISNIVSTVKRWRNSRAPGGGDDNSFRGRGSFTLRSRAKMAADYRQRHASEHAKQTNGVIPNGMIDADGNPAVSRDSTAGYEPPSQPPSIADGGRSEGSVASGRYSRSSHARPWRARSLMDSFKKSMGFNRSGTASTATPPPEVLNQKPILGDMEATEVPANIDPISATTPSRDDDAPNKSEIAEKESRRGNRRRSSSTGRVSRSSSRVRIRHRSKRRQSVLRGNSAATSETDQRKDNAWYSPDEMKRRMKTPDLSSLKSRFSIGEAPSRNGEGDAGRGHADNKLLRGFNITSWNLDDERKALALALLGNRSLARRRAKDVKGALFDAITSLELDPSWVRGYVRKAAALREEGDLEEARVCVLEGLRQDPEHAGLADMLHSIDIALEAEELAGERKQAQRLENQETPVDVISGQA